MSTAVRLAARRRRYPAGLAGPGLWRPAICPLLDAGEVLARARVDLDLVALFHEQGDLDDHARLQCGRLEGAADAIAPYARVGLGDLEDDRRGKLHPDGGSSMHRHDRG